jgi:hypothetical protein
VARPDAIELLAARIAAGRPVVRRAKRIAHGPDATRIDLMADQQAGACQAGSDSSRPVTP